MTARTVEPMGDAGLWAAVGPDGATPSTEVAMADETVIVGYGPDGRGARISATPLADGHRLRRALAPVDLSGFTELRLSLRADRPAGYGGAPFFLELRAGSAATPVEDPANTWHRLLPVKAAGRWDTVRLGLDDLTLTGPLTELQLRCLGGTGFTAYLDDLIAVTPRPFADADRALAARLAGIEVGGGAVPVTVRAAGEPAPAAPALDVLQFDVRPAYDRVVDAVVPRDFTALGARRTVPGDPYDIDYAVTPVAATRADQTALLEAVLDRLAPLDELAVDGERLPTRLVWIPGPNRIGGFLTDVPALTYRVSVRRTPPPVPPVRQVDGLVVTADLLEIA
ncbi:hypothetical protein [Streptomyces humi]|uniref:hypothetical protein n=1 Tax=Streptomyces humi TaxID=1428620 RepID=UPI0011604254|nr:hypothetical protein [Streptomyces humi]